MPGTTLNDNQTAIIAKLIARVERLERAINNLVSPTPVQTDKPPIFDWFGVVPDLLVTGAWYSDLGYTVTSVRISAITAGSGDTGIDLIVAGSTVTTVTLPSGDNTIVVTVNVPIPPATPFNMQTNGVGSGVADITVQPT
jgi:hypothetical protein